MSLRTVQFHPIWFCALLLSVPFGLTSPTRAEQHFGPIGVTIVPMASSTSGETTRHGYREIRVRLTNHSDQSHEVKLAVPAQQHRVYSYDSIVAITRWVSISPRSVMDVSLYQPNEHLPANDLGVSVDGKTYERTIGLPERHSRDPYSYYSGSFPKPSILVSRAIDGRGRDRLEQSDVNVFRAETGPRNWPTHWLSYSRFDGVVLTKQDIDALPPAVAEALRRYVECGGILTVLHASNPPEVFGPLRFPDRQQANAGFGLVFFAPHQLHELPNVVFQKLNNEWTASGKRWDTNVNEETAERVFPVRKQVEIPIRSLLVIIIAFAVLIGPVNLWLLSRYKRRIWLLWIVPLVSLLTCSGVFAYTTISEGWYGHIRMDLLTVLDQREHRATTVGWAGYHCPITPSEGLHFSPETELSLLTEGESWGRGNPRFLTMDWTGDQHLETDWIRARRSTHFRLRKSQTRRERLAVHDLGTERPTVVNGLGAPIHTLVLADARGNLWRAGPMEPGAKSTLTRMPKRKAEGKGEALVTLYRKDWLRATKDVMKRPERYLRPMTYVADLDGGDFVQRGLKQSQTDKSKTVVYGLLERSADNGR